LIFGDRGEVKFSDGVTVFARLGGAGPGDFTDGVIRNVYSALSTDANDNGNDTIHGSDSKDFIIGGSESDMIYGGLDSDLIIGDQGYVLFDSSVAYKLVQANTTEFTTGGVDVIYGEEASDWLLGGVGGDIINAGDGDNIVLGDNGYILFGDLMPQRPETVESTDVGDGNDTVLLFSLLDFFYSLFLFVRS